MAEALKSGGEASEGREGVAAWNGDSRTIARSQLFSLRVK